MSVEGIATTAARDLSNIAATWDSTAPVMEESKDSTVMEPADAAVAAGREGALVTPDTTGVEEGPGSDSPTVLTPVSGSDIGTG